METVLLTIWPFLNMLVGVGAIWLFVRFVNRFSQNFGCGSAAIVFLVGVSMCKSTDGQQNNVSGKQNQFLLQQPQPASPILMPIYRQVTLLASPSYSIDGYITITPVVVRDSAQTGTANRNDLTISMIASATGFTTGLVWKPLAASVLFSENRQLTYRASGLLSWQVLNIPIYAQIKEFDGQLAL